MREDFVAFELNNQELLNRIVCHNAHERKVQVLFLTCLSEIDKRQLFLEQGFPSLFKYVVEVLNHSESSALKRIQVARVARRLPQVYWALEEGKVSLTALSKLSPYLNQSNVEFFLKASEKKTVKEVETLLACHFPRENSDPDKIQPLDEATVSIQFKASKRFNEKLEKARALLSHKYPKGKLAEVFEEALDELLRIKKPKKTHKKTTSQTRHIPQVIQNEVWERDEGKCTYVSPTTGRRCNETHLVQFDHIYPYALGGKPEVKNLRLLCWAHNQYVAQDFFSRAWLETGKRQREWAMRERLTSWGQPG